MYDLKICPLTVGTGQGRAYNPIHIDICVHFLEKRLKMRYCDCKPVQHLKCVLTRCLNHCRPVSPSESVKPLSASISRSFNMRLRRVENSSRL